jgi:hypothetical protein
MKIALFCFYRILILWFDVYFFVQVKVNQDTAAMFAYDDFFMLAYFGLALRWYYVEAAAA